MSITAASGLIDPGKVLCAESVKLVSPVLITETGNEQLDGFP